MGQAIHEDVPTIAAYFPTLQSSHENIDFEEKRPLAHAVHNLAPSSANVSVTLPFGHV